MNNLHIPLVDYDSDEKDESSSEELRTFVEKETHIGEREIDELGKVRNVPHAPGLWATHVSLPIDSVELKPILERLVAEINRQLTASNRGRVYLMDELHISLSTTVYLREIQIHPFIEKLRERLKEQGPKAFHVKFDRIESFINEEGTRSFLAIGVNPDYLESLHELLNDISSPVLRHFSCPVLEHDPPVFHASFAWAPNDLLCTGRESLFSTGNETSFCSEASIMVLPHVTDRLFRINRLTVRAGNIIQVLMLAQ